MPIENLNKWLFNNLKTNDYTAYPKIHCKKCTEVVAIVLVACGNIAIWKICSVSHFKACFIGPHDEEIKLFFRKLKEESMNHEKACMPFFWTAVVITRACFSLT